MATLILYLRSNWHDDVLQCSADSFDTVYQSF